MHRPQVTQDWARRPRNAHDILGPSTSPQAQEGEDMSPGSSRKKPICQKCGTPMAGHKRPYGIPICPNEENMSSSPSRSPTPASKTQSLSPAFGPPDSPSPGEPTLPLTTSPRLTAQDGVMFNPSASGYWHRSNPNWVNSEIERSAALQRRSSAMSWVTTERDDGSTGTPTRRQMLPSPIRQEVIDVDKAEEDTFRQAQETEPEHEHGGLRDDMSDAQSVASDSSSATILKRMTRGLSRAIGRSTPLASLYSSPSDQITAITSAAEAEGLYTRIMHRNRNVMKSEPATPLRTTPTREHSWWVAVGRDRNAVDALVEPHSPSKPLSAVRRADTVLVEPYDYDRGLNYERNERIGTFPSDPRWIRNTFFDLLVAGAVGGFVVFYCLSSL